MAHPLKTLAALALDCQTTGPKAGQDHLLEIGWLPIAPSSKASGDTPSAYWVSLPEGVGLAPKIVELTNIQEDDFQLAGVPDRLHYTVGPLPSEHTLAAFRFIVAQCGRSTATLPADTEELAAATDIPVRYVPPITAFEDGLNVYRTICGYRGDLRRTARQLLKRGLLLWRRRHHQVTVDKDQTAPEISDEREWTTDAVVEMLDGIVRRGSHLVRRGRWLQILANATLSWDTPSRTTAPERTLYIRQGRISPAPQGAAHKGANRPTTATPSRSAARHIFTSDTTYDRLRVLTTELRRLLAEERRIVFSPAVGGSVGSRGLARLLSFI